MNTSRRLILLVGGVLAVLVVIGVLRFAMHGSDRAAGLRAAFDAEFLTRPDGYVGLQEHYGFTLPSDPKQMDPGLMYRAVADGAVDIIDGFATDGRIPAYNLTVLTDDKEFFPPYYAAPVIRSATLAAHPALGTLLRRLGGRISNDTMQQLNYEADEKGRKAAAIARDFLVREGLIEAGAQPGDGTAERIAVGSKHFTEQEILGELMAILIETQTDLRVERKLNLGGTMICFNALRAGDLDLYAEYTGTGLVNILDRGVITDSETAYDTVRRQFKQDYDLVWLAPFGFNNTYTLTMRTQDATEREITTISDLAAYLNQP